MILLSKRILNASRSSSGISNFLFLIIKKAKSQLKYLRKWAEDVNEELLEIMKDPSNFENGEFDLSDYAHLWGFLELPREVMKDFTLASNRDNSKVLLCTHKRGGELILEGEYGCKYY